MLLFARRNETGPREISREPVTIKVFDDLGEQVTRLSRQRPVATRAKISPLEGLLKDAHDVSVRRFGRGPGFVPGVCRTSTPPSQGLLLFQKPTPRTSHTLM